MKAETLSKGNSVADAAFCDLLHYHELHLHTPISFVLNTVALSMLGRGDALAW